MQGFDLALFQQGAADQPSILLKHLDPNTRQEAQQDIAAYKTKLKDEREQKKQKTVIRNLMMAMIMHKPYGTRIK